MRPPVADDEAHARFGERAAAFAVEEARGLDDFRGDLHDVRAPHGALGQRGADRDTAAQSDHDDVLCVAVEEHGQQAEQALREHVAAVRRIDLAVDGERRGTGQPTDADGRGCAFLVVLEHAGAQHRVEIVRREVGRVFVRAAREKLAVPGRQEKNGSQRCDGDAGWPQHGPWSWVLGRQSAKSHKQAGRAPEGAEHSRHLKRRPQSERRDERETCGQRAGDRAERVGGVHARGVAADRRRAARGDREREWKRGAECQRHRQQQQCGAERLRDDDAAEGNVGIRHLLGHDERHAARRHPGGRARGDRGGDEHGREPDRRPTRMPRQARPQRGPDRQAADDRGRHRRKGVRRGPDDEREQSRPGDFVNERGEPGERRCGAGEAR